MIYFSYSVIPKMIGSFLNNMLIAFVILIVLSILLALRSMSDFHIPKELQKLLKTKNIKGTFIFLKDTVEHHSSSSESRVS